jgi:hypothetical protein
MNTNRTIRGYKEIIFLSIPNLKDNEKFVLAERIQNKSMEDIASRMLSINGKIGVSRERVRQIEWKANHKLVSFVKGQIKVAKDLSKYPNLEITELSMPQRLLNALLIGKVRTITDLNYLLATGNIRYIKNVGNRSISYLESLVGFQEKFKSTTYRKELKKIANITELLLKLSNTT